MAIIYMNGRRESLILPAESKSAGFIILSTIWAHHYPKEFEAKETVIVIKGFNT